MKINEVNQYFRKLQVLKPYHISRTIDNWLLFKFSSYGSSPEKDKDAWNLRVYSPWLIKTKDQGLATSYSEEESVDKALAQFQQMPLTHFNVSPSSYEATFEFDQRLFLRIFPVQHGDPCNHKKTTLTWQLDQKGSFAIRALPGHPLLVEHNKS